jgi:nucleoside-diphosphate-sugar epimerase
MKKILVTGATGFIGNYVIRELLNKNHQVIATSSSAEKARQQSWYDKVNYLPFNLAADFSTINLYQYFNQPDLLIHLAWEGLPNYKAAFHLEENLPRHVDFLTNLLSNGLADLTVTGTCFEYGMKEGCLNEEMPADPANPYAKAKDALRKKLQEYQHSRSFNFKWVRLFYMYGKGQNPNSLLSQLDKALEEGKESFNMSGGEQVRDFLPVEAVAMYITEIALQKEVTGIINCCSGVPVTVKKLVQDYLKRKNKNITLNLGYYPYPDYEPMAFWGDNRKLKMIHNE